MPDNLNLTPERGPSVWDEKWRSAVASQTGSTVGGAVMLAAGAAAAFFGGRMLYRAMRQPRAAARDMSSARHDAVEDESAASFPASDAPSWTAAGAVAGQRGRMQNDEG